MSKLPEKHQFLDLSDYGRSLGHFIATKLEYSFNAYSCNYHVSNYWIYSYRIIAKRIFYCLSFFVTLKTILDAADGELARLKNRLMLAYYDSISDLILNFCFLLSLWYITDISIIYMIFSFSNSTSRNALQLLLCYIKKFS